MKYTKRQVLVFILFLLSLSLLSLSSYAQELFIGFNSSIDIQKRSASGKLDEFYITYDIDKPLDVISGDKSCRFTDPMRNQSKAHLECNFEGVLRPKYFVLPINHIKYEPSTGNYLDSTRFIVANDSEIKNISSALKISYDLSEYVFNLAEFVRKNTRKTDDKARLNSKEVLDSRNANDFGMASLFTGLLRSVKIPARIVQGIVVHDNGYRLRFWSEVRFPEGWVPYDIFDDELGFLDFRHVALQIVKDDPSIITYRSDSISDNKDFLFFPQEPLINTELLGIVDEPKLFNADVNSNFVKVGFGSYNLITVSVSNPTDKYLATRVDIVVPDELELKQRPKVPLLIPPRSSRSAFFIVHVKQTLDRKRSYRLNIPVHVFGAGDLEANFKADTLGKMIDIKDIKKEYIKLNKVYNSKAMEIVLMDDNPLFAVTEDMINNTAENIGIERTSKETDAGTEITLKITPRKQMYDFMVYENIPKCLAEKIDEVLFKEKGIRIINPDPLIVWDLDDTVDDVVELTYTVKKNADIEDCTDSIVTIAVAKKIADEYLKTEAYESMKFFYFAISILIIPIIVVSIIFFNKFSGKIGKYSSDTASLKEYVSHCRSLGYSDDDIKRVLKENGYVDETIEEAL